MWAGAVLALFLVVFSAQKLMKTPAPTEEKTVPGWKRSFVDGVSLETPGTFQETRVDLGPLQSKVEQADSHRCETGGLESQVIRILYKEDTMLSLEGSVEGSINGFTRAPGITDVVHNQAPCTISGKPAIRVWMGARQGPIEIHFQGITILDDHTLYQVQALYKGREEIRGVADLKRICDSVKIGP